MIIVNSVGEKQIVVQLGETENDIVMQMTKLALENNDYCRARAAKYLGIGRTTIVMRLKKWGLDAETP